MNCIVTISTLFCILVKSGNAFSPLSYISDEDIDIQKHSHIGIAVITLHAKESSASFGNVTSALEGASVTLEKFDIKIYKINCDASEADVCQNEQDQTKLHLFKKGNFIIALDFELISSQSVAEGNILHWLSPPTFLHITNELNWNKLQNECIGKRNIMMVYTYSLGTELFSSFINASLEYKEKIQFAYTIDHVLATLLMQTDAARSNTTMWIEMCAEQPLGGSCVTVKYEDLLTRSLFDEILKAMVSSTVVLINSSAPVNTLQKRIDEAIENNYDVVLMIAGHRKHGKAIKLARTTCTLTVGKARCIVIQGDIEITNVPDYVDNDRIYLTILSKEGQHDDIEIGYLLAESPDEIYHHWRRLDTRRRVRDYLTEKKFDDVLTDAHTEDIESPYDVQDDPVVYSVHDSKALRDLYLHDYKTISRLTDVTYDQLISSNRYAVILFTLEFNAKSLAVLSTFVRIHKEIVAENGHSPLHRLECFDWPDVCKKAGCFTYPKMFIYRSDEVRTPIEYDRVWSEDEMRNFIKLSSLDWPILADTKKDLARAPSTAIHGIVSTQSGETVLRTAARRYGNKYPFVMVRDEAAQLMSSSRDIGSDGEDYLFVRSSQGVITRPFSTIDHVIDFIQLAFHNEPMKELTVSNFNEILSNPLRLFIFYRNTSGDSPVSDDQTLEFLIDISAKLKEEATFVWMNACPGTPGEYSLYMHSRGEVSNSALAFLDKKGSVSLKSLQGTTSRDDINRWVSSCLAGESPVTFELLDVAWKPRLPGHDYLQSMRDEGTLPLKSSNQDHVAKHQTGHRVPQGMSVDDMETGNTQPIMHTEL